MPLRGSIGVAMTVCEYLLPHDDYRTFFKFFNSDFPFQLRKLGNISVKQVRLLPSLRV